jgi:hypothetical protein
MATNQPHKLADFGPLTKAEQQVLDELDTGEGIRLLAVAGLSGIIKSD